MPSIALQFRNELVALIEDLVPETNAARPFRHVPDPTNTRAGEDANPGGDGGDRDFRLEAPRLPEDPNEWSDQVFVMPYRMRLIMKVANVPLDTAAAFDRIATEALQIIRAILRNTNGWGAGTDTVIVRGYDWQPRKPQLWELIITLDVTLQET